MAVFLFLLQAFTGVLLAFNYAPTPGEAYNSLKYIITELTGGSLIRGLHHWGSSMMIAVVVLHMIQVFAAVTPPGGHTATNCPSGPIRCSMGSRLLRRMSRGLAERRRIDSLTMPRVSGIFPT
jgi:hypothetical protein